MADLTAEHAELIAGLRRDAGDYRFIVLGVQEPGRTYSWDKGEERAWAAAELLEASLSRESADLDVDLLAVERRAEMTVEWVDADARHGDGCWPWECVCGVAQVKTLAREDVPMLLDRVRTAEAERDEQAKQREHWATENNSLWSWIVALGALAKKGGFQDGGLGWQTCISRAVHAAVEDRALRTVETAEERTVLGVLPAHEDGSTDWPAFAQQILDASPVPPAPEEQ